MLTTNDRMDELVSVLARISGLDEELAGQCGGLIREQRFDDAVSRAFVLLEERMRKLMAMRGGTGRHLVSKLFSETDSQFVDRLDLPEEEWKGLRSIFDGAFAAYRNRAAHTVAGYGLEDAQAIVNLVNLLLLVVRQMREAPDKQVPEKMAQALGKAATHRLNLFLDKVARIGIVRAAGSQYPPYKAKLLYHAPHWEEPKPHRLAVFYLNMDQEPALGFNIVPLSRVPGLDAEALSARLLQEGCVRAPGKDVTVRLVLAEHNDQPTFDRLYEILRDLMEKHRA